MSVGNRSGESAASDENTRSRRSKHAVLTATHQLLTEGGLAGVSVDEVARRSGVAKTTIYRHWPSRSALLLDACSQMSGETAIPDTGSLHDDLAELLGDLAGQLREPGWPTVLPSIIDAAERDTETAAMHAALHQALMQPFTAVIRRAQRDGELAGGHEPAKVVALLTGPLFYRRWFSREPLDEDFIDDVLRAVIRPRT